MEGISVAENKLLRRQPNSIRTRRIGTRNKHKPPHNGNRAQPSEVGDLDMADEKINMVTIFVPAAVALVTTMLTLIIKPVFDKKLETHKWQLKKRELFLDREIAAAVEFENICNKILDVTYREDLDHFDACCDIAYNYRRNPNCFESFVSKYRIFISNEAIEMITSLPNSSPRSEVDESVEFDNLTEDEEKDAKYILENLPKIRDLLFSEIREK